MTHRSWLDQRGNLVSQPTLSLEEIRAIVDEAHGWGKKVACHAYNGVGLHRALDGGCDSIEHGLELDDAAVAQMVKQGTWLCPTMSVYYDHWAPADTPAGSATGSAWSCTGRRSGRRSGRGSKSRSERMSAGFRGRSRSRGSSPDGGVRMTPMAAIQSATSQSGRDAGHVR
jgi:hypothetical protein